MRDVGKGDSPQVLGEAVTGLAGPCVTTVGGVDDDAAGPVQAARSDGPAVRDVRGVDVAGVVGKGDRVQRLAFPALAAIRGGDDDGPVDDPTHGWAVGGVVDGAVVVATSDGGESWERQALDAVTFADDFRDVDFPDVSNGWAVGAGSLDGTGGVIVNTADGGNTWTRQTGHGFAENLWGVSFPTSRTAGPSAPSSPSCCRVHPALDEHTVLTAAIRRCSVRRGRASTIRRGRQNGLGDPLTDPINLYEWSEFMTFNASWVHGNALTVESPEVLDRVGHAGWGADMRIKPGKASWFHIALPTPVVVGDSQTKLERVFIMFSTTSG